MSQDKLDILLVDDQPAGLLAMQAVLEDLGQNLVLASSGREALRRLLDRDFAVILLDVQMPEMDGYETAALIRERERSRLTPILFLTATHQSPANALQGYSAGAVDYIFKPYEAAVLRSKVKVFVDLARQDAEMKRLNRALEHRVEQLTAVNQDLEAFSHMVCHDLKAPLRSIAGFGKILLEEFGGALSPEGRDTLDRILRASDRMNDLIQDLLALARVTHQDLRPGPVDLARLARAAIEELRRAEPERKVTVAVAGPLQATADPGLARVVLDNLLGNAWKYTRKRPEARIEMGVEAGEDGRRQFFVRDDGVGFDMRQANKLFAPFQRFHAASEFEGTGIGLATVQRILVRHGGRIAAHSAPGEGATFHFSFEP